MLSELTDRVLARSLRMTSVRARRTAVTRSDRRSAARQATHVRSFRAAVAAWLARPENNVGDGGAMDENSVDVDNDDDDDDDDDDDEAERRRPLAMWSCGTVRRWLLEIELPGVAAAVAEHAGRCAGRDGARAC